MIISNTREVVETTCRSDAELLRAIRQDLHFVYKELLKKPLPWDIETLVSRLEAHEHQEHNAMAGQVIARCDIRVEAR